MNNQTHAGTIPQSPSIETQLQTEAAELMNALEVNDQLVVQLINAIDFILTPELPTQERESKDSQPERSKSRMSSLVEEARAHLKNTKSRLDDTLSRVDRL